ncbi:MAG: AraC family transcriptional regulator ligand-binding domain-containing protein, partial [Myxococcota bacterium]
MAKGEPLFHFRLTPLVLRMLGLDPEAAKRLLKKKGLPESAAEGPCSVPLSRVRALLDEAQVLRGPASFGVALAAAASDGTYGMAELIGRSSETIEEGLRALTRFGPLINPIGRFEVVGEERCELHYHVLGSREGLGPVLNEFTVAYILNAFERAATGPVRPEAVWVSHSPPAIRELNEHFGVPVRKGAASCGFALSW